MYPHCLVYLLLFFFLSSYTIFNENLTTEICFAFVYKKYMLRNLNKFGLNISKLYLYILSAHAKIINN